MSVTCYTPQHSMLKLATAKFHSNFQLFHCLESFCTLSDAFQALLSAEFKFVLKSWSLNSCLICGSMKTPFFHLASLIWENLCLKQPNLSLSLSIAFTDIFKKPSFICNGGKQILDLPTEAECATFF